MIRLVYWSQEAAKVNFGDYATEAILSKLGLAFEHFDPNRHAAGDPVFFGVGTMLDDYWLKKRTDGRPVIVWGSGYGGGGLSLPIRADVRAVRGPLTRSHLGLPDTIPLGDPALFLPRFFPRPTVPGCSAVYVPHWEAQRRAGPVAVAAHADQLGASRILSPMIPREQFTALLGHIAAAGFVFASSLHGAIVAQAYGVPWAPALMPGEKFNLSKKWIDWAQYLGLDAGELMTPRENPREWWERYGCRGRVRDLEPLARAFPFSASLV